MLLTRVLSKLEGWWYGVNPMVAALVIPTGDLIAIHLLQETDSGKSATRLW